jgi:hypothetical protein
MIGKTGFSPVQTNIVGSLIFFVWTLATPVHAISPLVRKLRHISELELNPE